MYVLAVYRMLILFVTYWISPSIPPIFYLFPGAFHHSAACWPVFTYKPDSKARSRPSRCWVSGLLAGCTSPSARQKEHCVCFMACSSTPTILGLGTFPSAYWTVSPTQDPGFSVPSLSQSQHHWFPWAGLSIIKRRHVRSAGLELELESILFMPLLSCVFFVGLVSVRYAYFSRFISVCFLSALFW